MIESAARAARGSRGNRGSVMQSVDVLVIGGGAAGIGTAASIRRRHRETQITVIEPESTHFYQPAWTLVAGGLYDQARSGRAPAAFPPGCAGSAAGR